MRLANATGAIAFPGELTTCGQVTPRGQYPGPITQSPAGLEQAYVVHIDSARLEPEVPFSRVQPKEGWGDKRLRRAALGCCGEG